jgi:hypothetical protein
MLSKLSVLNEEAGSSRFSAKNRPGIFPEAVPINVIADVSVDNRRSD